MIVRTPSQSMAAARSWWLATAAARFGDVPPQGDAMASSCVRIQSPAKTVFTYRAANACNATLLHGVGPRYPEHFSVGAPKKKAAPRLLGAVRE